MPGDTAAKRRAARANAAVQRNAPKLCRCSDVSVGETVEARNSRRKAVVAEVKKGGWLVVRWDDAPDDEVFCRPSNFHRPKEAC